MTVDLVRQSPLQMRGQPDFPLLSSSQELAPNPTENELEKLRKQLNITADDKVTLDNGETVPIEFLLHVLLASCIEQGAQHLKLIKDLLDKERGYQSVKEKQRTEQMDKVLKDAGALKTTSKVDKICTAGSLAASGLEGILQGNYIVGIPTVISGVLLAADHYFEDAGKKQIASWIAQGDKESELSWLGRLDFAASIASLGLSFGLTGSKALTIAKSVSQAALTGVKGTLQHRMNVDQELLKHLDASCERSERTIKRYFNDLDVQSTTWHNHVSTKFEAEQKRNDLLMLFLPRK
jgi:hypothetical protein